MIYDLTCEVITYSQPKAETIGVLLNPNFPYAAEELRQIQAAAERLGQRIHILRAGAPVEIDQAFDLVAREHILALLVTADPFSIFAAISS